MKYVLSFVLILICLTCNAESVITELPCGDTKQIITFLKERYNETPIVIGLTQDQANSTMSLWANKILGTWTLIATKNDITCIVGTGTDLKIVPNNEKNI